ncbi:NAD-P-binding protein [Cubamyces sp. BRFM 1775]|nr:NAD-P-binding protein [Cubamyces sp. BRFM 1775]
MGSFTSKTQPEFDPATDLPDLTGKVMIVTGGNSGIGFTAALHLARRGAKVYIGARSEQRAKAAIERMRAEGLQPGNGTLEWFMLDLSDPRKAKESAHEFMKREDRLDVLVNNAGMYSLDYSYLGLQENMLVNHVSPFVFTKALLPLLSRTAKEPESDVRIVVVSSALIRILKGQELYFRDINDFNKEFGNMSRSDMYRYSLSKLANVLCVKELQRKLKTEDLPITVMSVDPGSVMTEGVERDPSMQTPIFGPLLKIILRRLFLTPSEGGYTSVFAVASPIVFAERAKYEGAWLEPPGKLGTPPTPHAESTELAAELWKTTETILRPFDL